MNVEKNVPVLRFEGFSDEWVEKPLNHEVELFSGLTYSPKDIRKEGVFVIRSSNVKNGQIVQADNVYVNPEVVNCSNVKEGDIIVVVRNGSRALIGKHAQVNSLMDNTVIGAFMTGVRASYPEFINALFDTDKFKAQVEKNLGATINQITNGAFNSMVFMFPEGQEKTAIGNTFQKLDNLINQHQQKHEKLSSLKKAMLEKMFPKQGKTIPEIRFKGFSGEWEVRSWRDTVDISTNMVDPRSSQYGELFHVGPGNIESFTGMFYNNVLKVKDSNLISGKFHFNKGDIIYGKINPQLAKYVIAPFEGLASADAYVLSAKNGVVQNYLYAILQTEDFYKYTVSVSSRTGMPKINRDELNIYSYLSPDEAEQERIGSYFQKLDALINQHQQQITKLNNIKQACLSKMFV
ncbi:restriction endonuclease subunit S [Thalassotalea sp. LPB0316]|uniref:restriction endonuclease subunit S n=1 Tax=Thalassotalea sp. LPB0316 TaxID=2769490 RepID=UPI001867026E|nr:restriction endonuclease subunit S [Thalassotalea sp. LPB0316]QOL25458.1 restriction endonuclease subunit S [Thalassotalea sp. LPB0316]